MEWNTGKINTLFPQHISEITSIKPSRLGAADNRIWIHHHSGVYSTKYGYYIVRDKACKPVDLLPLLQINWKSEVWSVVIAPKIKTFLWKAHLGALPTGTQLEARHVVVDPVCFRYNYPESILHALFTCSFAQQIWQ